MLFVIAALVPLVGKEETRRSRERESVAWAGIVSWKGYCTFLMDVNFRQKWQAAFFMLNLGVLLLCVQQFSSHLNPFP